MTGQLFAEVQTEPDAYRGKILRMFVRKYTCVSFVIFVFNFQHTVVSTRQLHLA